MTRSLRMKLLVEVVLEMGEEVQGIQDGGRRGYAPIVRLRTHMVEVIVRFVGCLYRARWLDEGEENLEILNLKTYTSWMDFLRAVGRLHT